MTNQPAICYNCKHCLRSWKQSSPTLEIYENLSQCTAYDRINYVTGEKQHESCAYKNSIGKCPKFTPIRENEQ